VNGGTSPELKARPRESVLQRKPTLGELLDLPSFQQVVQGFAELNRLGIKVFDEAHEKLADVRMGSAEFCAYAFTFAEGKRKCTATVTRVREGEVNVSPVMPVPCFTGLRYLVLPVVWEGDPLGRVVFGPFIPDSLGDLPESFTSIDPGIDKVRAAALLKGVRRASDAQVLEVMQEFAHVLESLVAAGQKAFLTSQLHIEATLEMNRELEAKTSRLEGMNARLKELDQLKSSFLATVSHELRTPLTSIIGYSEMLAEGLAGPLNPEQLDYVKTIMEKGETLLKLISSILDIGQIEAGKVRLNFAPVDLVRMIHSSVTSVKPQAQRKGVALETRLPAADRVKAVADRDRLHQVVVNLLANAVKFTQKGGRIVVSLSEVEPQPALNGDLGYRIEVEDSGVGIPESQFEKIFQTFYQVDGSSTREFGGAGLGLAIVKSLVEGHGGTVTVTSQEGTGSMFSAVLPAEPPSGRGTPAATPVVVPDRF
jgi:two-component system sensor histidine kinase BarA